MTAFFGPNSKVGGEGTLVLKNKGKLSGVVKDHDTGAGIEGATVKAARYWPNPDFDPETYDPENPDPANVPQFCYIYGTATTDATGHWEMDLYPGSYDLSAEHPDYVYAGGGAILGPAQEVGGMVITMEPVSLSVSTARSAICAGGIASAPHQTTVTAVVRTTDGLPVPGKMVRFTILCSDAQYPAALSATAAVTDANGEAAVTLTSSRKLDSTATVTASCGSVEATTNPVAMADVTPQWSMAPDELIADGESTAEVALTLVFDGVGVDGHQVTWRINRIWDEDDELVYTADPQSGSAEGYGSLSPITGTTSANGMVKTQYTAGIRAGTIEFAALDYSVVTKSPRVHTIGKPLAANVFYILTHPGNEGPGEAHGDFDARRFHLVLRALNKRSGTTPPPLNTIFFKPKRPATNTALSFIDGDRCSADDPATPFSEAPDTTSYPGYTVWTFRSGLPGWHISRQMGRWQVVVHLYGGAVPVQQGAWFKIDKRQQIVELAEHWATGTPSFLQSMDIDLCNDFVAQVYNQLGLELSTGGVGPQHDSTSPCQSGDGCLAFFSLAFHQTWDPGHAAIQKGNQRINVNSAAHPGAGVASTESLLASVGTVYKSEVHYRSACDLDAE